MLSQMVRLSWHSIVYGIGAATSSLVGFLLVPVYTRHLNPSEYGALEIFQVTLTILGVLFTMGLTTALFKSYFAYQDEAKRRTVVSTAFAFITLTSLVFALGMQAVAARLSLLFFGDYSYSLHFRLVFLTVFFDTGVLMALSVLRAREQPARYVLFVVVRVVLLLVLNIAFVAILQRSIQGVLESGLIAAGLTYLLAVVPLVRRTGFRLAPAELRVMLVFGLPLIISGLGSWILTLSDRYFLQFLSTPRELGLYSLGYKFGLVIQVLLNAPLQLAWLPFVFSMGKEGNAREVFSRVLTYFLLVAMFVALAVSALSKEVLAIMATPAFQGAYQVIPLIALAYVVFGCYTIVSVGIYLESKTKFLAMIIGTAALLNLGLNFLLIPPYGMMGAAVATLISYALAPLAAYLISRRYYAIPYEWSRIFKIAAVAALLFTGAILLDKTYVWLNSYWVVGALKLATVASYPLALYVCGFFRPEETGKLYDLLAIVKCRVIKR